MSAMARGHSCRRCVVLENLTAAFWLVQIARRRELQAALVNILTKAYIECGASSSWLCCAGPDQDEHHDEICQKWNAFLARAIRNVVSDKVPDIDHCIHTHTLPALGQMYAEMEGDDEPSECTMTLVNRDAAMRKRWADSILNHAKKFGR